MGANYTKTLQKAPHRNALKSLIALDMTMLALAAPMANAQDADVKSRGLFVNLTTDDTWSAAKAISFAHEKALRYGQSPVAICWNFCLTRKSQPNSSSLLRRPTQGT